MAVERADHTQSSFPLDYWFRRCDGFRVDGPGGRIGHVRTTRFGASAEPEALEIRAGMLGRRTLIVPVSEIEQVIPEQRRLILRGSPRLVGSESASTTD